MRRKIVLLAVLAWCLIVLCVFARVPFSAPPLAMQREVMEGASFAALGGAEQVGTSLSVTAEAEDHGVVIVRSVNIADAAKVPLLRYRFDGFPVTMELVFLYRRSDSPQDVRTVALVPSRGGTGSIDLSAESDWHGSIVELGFAAYPTAQSVPPERGFRPFRLQQAELWSASWYGSFSAAWTEWTGRRAWMLMSISALGPDGGHARAGSPVLLLVMWIIGSIFFVAWLGRWPRQRVFRLAVGATVSAWALLDLRWMVSLADRHAATRQIYAGSSWQQRQVLLPDSDMASVANRVQATLGDSALRTRILVDSVSDYGRARLIYHLAPANAVPFNLIGHGPASARAGMYLLLFDLDKPEYDVGAASLVLQDGTRLPATVVIDEPPLRLYRFTSETAP